MKALEFLYYFGPNQHSTIAENKQIECGPNVEIEILPRFKQLEFFFRRKYLFIIYPSNLSPDMSGKENTLQGNRH